MDKQYGIRYHLNALDSTTPMIFQQRNNGPCYQIGQSTLVTWGGKDSIYNSCHYEMQYLRIYLDWTVDSKEKMINLALMDTKGKLNSNIFEKATLYQFYFASDPQTNNNQTFIVNTLTNTSETNVIGLKVYLLSINI